MKIGKQIFFKVERDQEMEEKEGGRDEQRIKMYYVQLLTENCNQYALQTCTNKRCKLKKNFKPMKSEKLKQ